jgi:hypothetical protein
VRSRAAAGLAAIYVAFIKLAAIRIRLRAYVSAPSSNLIDLARLDHVLPFRDLGFDVSGEVGGGTALVGFVRIIFARR